MNKEQMQKSANFAASVMFHAAMREYTENGYTSCSRLRYCSAYVYETENYYLLKSYDTFIAVISKRSRNCFDMLRKVYGYTATSAKHVSAFWHDYGGSDCKVFTAR